VIDIFTSEDMENISLCISQYLTLYYIMYEYAPPPPPPNYRSSYGPVYIYNENWSPKSEVKYGAIRYQFQSLGYHYCLRGVPCEGTNSARLFTPGERNALAKSKDYQISWARGSPFIGGHPH
jgi:hypothetical protein